jgi:16S rRNA (adenine1518-N6/adenine1519-N6)-dimethyltransferase
VMIQSFYSVQSVVRLSPGDFYPAPKVQSKVLAFKSIKNDSLKTTAEKRKFLVFLKELFKMRRKTVLNNLKGLSKQPKELLQTLGISEKLRPEQLDIATITKMFIEREKQNGN